MACQLSGYGGTGPYADRKAYDLLVQAEAGVLAVTGSPDAQAKAGISVADIACGMYAYSAVLAALLRRERTGRGDVITISLLDALAEWMSHPLLATRLTGTAPPRTGARHSSIVPYGAYTTADGHEIMLAVQNEGEWERLCREVLDVPDMAADPRFAGNERRVARRAEAEERLARAVAALPAADLLGGLDAARIAYASMRQVAEVLTHPALAGRWMTIGAGDRDVDVLPRPPGTPGSARRSDQCPGWASTPTRSWPSWAWAHWRHRDAGAWRKIVTLVGVDPYPVAALTALFDDGLPEAGPGDPLPPYWHLAACAVPPPTGVLGPDGHPRSGLVTAPPGRPRRMFAAAPVRARRGRGRRAAGPDAAATASTDKQGRSGPLRFSTAESVFRHPDGDVVLVEEQDIVYRTAGAPAPAPARAQAPRRARAGLGDGPGRLLTRPASRCARCSAPTPWPCNASPPPPPTRTGSTTTIRTSPRSRGIRAWSCMARCCCCPCWS